MVVANDFGKGTRTDRPLILFGAFDRHNFGDLLLGETARVLVSPEPVVFAGLADRDLSAHGGERVRAITTLAREWGDGPADVLHVGGELLTCTLYEAAIMLQSDEDAQRAIARHDANSKEGHAWAARCLGMDQKIAYLVSRQLFRRSGSLGYLGVGGMELDLQPNDVRKEAFSRLEEADYLWVRDRETHRLLAMAGIHAQLAPDPAELTAVLFGCIVEKRALAERQRAICEHFPAGYIAVQFGADIGDDATLAIVGRQLRQVQREHGLGIVFFRAGAAPWHDRLEVYGRLLHGASELDAIIFDSLNIWDICALLAGSRGFVGSSLHGRIVAEAFGQPAVSLVRIEGVPSKTGVYVESWRPDASGTVVVPEYICAAWRRALLLKPGNHWHCQRVVTAVDAFREALGLAPLWAGTSIQA